MFPDYEKLGKNFACFKDLKSIFEFTFFIEYFGRSHRIITAVPHGRPRKLRLTRPSAPSATPSEHFY